MSDGRWMDLALSLARQGVGQTAPNPSVGAVVVRDGELLGAGWTRPAGGAHAEVVALEAARAAGHDLQGATMYVTLEPCCHHGKNPPCTDAILAAGLSRVVAGIEDPFPPMQGKGLEILRHAGVEVALGVRAEACAEVVGGFTRAISHGLPLVTCKAGVSADGRIATAAGESQWITGPEARAHSNALRGTHDAILVGIGTVLADDPRLTCRVQQGVDPVPVVLDSELRIPADAALLRSTRRALILTAEDAPARALDADVVRIPRGEGGVDIEAALRVVAGRGLHRVLVEGGGLVHRSLFDAGLVDHLLLYLGGVLIPGGRPWIGGPPIPELAAAVRLYGLVVEPLGEGALLRWRVKHRLEV
ncbi:MAG: bifunctional diaminohydroxyphosphoribosylaminopyrimidine deaminase/5-amino-6-(5-phosphoribosylamino)uracil reductase RibD [Deltaproteobacteria bacterium]|nr:bifunctional diaminohydroxyphosphoribosylaminopyrimidine deaminase/5-amino-6-(5-phosphoribosylamino)uracil reductase RibD [Deltaproteobacteria bacterium]